MTVVFNSVADFNLETLERVAVRAEKARFGADALLVIAEAHDAFQRYLSANPAHLFMG